jgi:hypothetical protein
MDIYWMKQKQNYYIFLNIVFTLHCRISTKLTFYAPAFKNVGDMLYRCHLSICPFHFVFSTPPKSFLGFWWNLVQRKITLYRCAYCKGSPVQLFFKMLQTLDLAFTLSLQFLLKSLEDFDETWYKERSHCVDVYIVRGILSNHFSRSYGP